MIRRAVRFASKPILGLLLALSLLLNFATVTISGVYTAVSMAASTIGLSTVAAREAGEKLAEKRATRQIVNQTSKRVSHRVAKGVARTTATSVGEAIPLVGVAIIAGSIAVEVDDACDTARDMAGLEGALSSPDDPQAGQKQAMAEFSCTELIPEAEDLPSAEDIWTSMLSAPGNAWGTASAYMGELPEIDLSGKTEWIFIAAGKRLEQFSDWIWHDQMNDASDGL